MQGVRETASKLRLSSDQWNEYLQMKLLVLMVCLCNNDIDTFDALLRKNIYGFKRRIFNINKIMT